MRNALALVFTTIIGFGIVHGACTKQVGKNENTEMTKALGRQCVAVHSQGLTKTIYYVDWLSRKGAAYHLRSEGKVYVVPVAQTVLQNCPIVYNEGV